MCVLGACKLNVVVLESYLEEALNFITKIPINPKLCVWMYLLGSYKLNVVVHAGYLEEALNFTTKIPINPELGV